MKAISLWQPWASLLAHGQKRIETRTWQTAYRGPIAIHAARKADSLVQHVCSLEPFRSHLALLGISATSQLPLGVILGTARLVDVVPTDFMFDKISRVERAFGDYRSGRWAWIFEDFSPLVVPIACRGERGLFEATLP